MKKVLSFVAVAALLFATSAYTIQAYTNWKIDAEKSMVKFTMSAHGQELIGNFKGVKGEVKFDENDLVNSTINCTIDVATVNTGNERRDNHLRAKDFFAAETAPVSRFTSTKIEKTKEGYTATGNLLMKETTKEISFPFVYEGTKDAGTFKASFIIKRSEFSIGKPKADISDEVTIILEIPVTKAD